MVRTRTAGLHIPLRIDEKTGQVGRMDRKNKTYKLGTQWRTDDDGLVGGGGIKYPGIKW